MKPPTRCSPLATDVVDQYIDFATYRGFVCRDGFCTRKGQMLAFVSGSQWVLPQSRFNAFCRRRGMTAMRAIARARAAGTRIEKIGNGYLTFPFGLRAETARWRRARDVLGEYMLLAVFEGLAWIEGIQRRKGRTMAYVVGDQWRIPKETFYKFCDKKKFWSAWAIEDARTRGERITETPAEYILMLAQDNQICAPLRCTSRSDAEVRDGRTRISSGESDAAQSLPTRCGPLAGAADAVAPSTCGANGMFNWPFGKRARFDRLSIIVL
jgi:hypothetical protein